MDYFLNTLAANKYMLVVGLLIGAMCSVLSVYIVLRRMSLISEGVSHAGFGGIAISLIIGYYFPAMDLVSKRSGVETGSHIWWQIITGLFCLGTALLIGYVARRKRVSEDAAIGIFLVSAVALGNLLLHVRKSMKPAPVELESLLFGNFSQVTRLDVFTTLGTAIIVFAVIGLFYYQFLYTSLDEEMARVNGVRTGLVNTLQLMLISLVIVVCGRMVGFLMITALTIIPGATANMLSRRFAGVMTGSIIIGTLGTFGATLIALIRPFDSYPTGPIVVMILFLLFAAVWTFRHFVKPKAAEEDAALAPAHSHEKAPGSFGHGHSH